MSENIFVDVTDIFDDVFHESSFNSYESFEVLLRRFMSKTGYIYHIKSSHSASGVNRYRDEARSQALRYTSARFECTQCGKPKVNAKQRKTHCKPIGCESFFTISTAKGTLKVIKYNFIHNHRPVSESLRLAACKSKTLKKSEIVAVAASEPELNEDEIPSKKKRSTSATVPTLRSPYSPSPATSNQTKQKQNARKKYKQSISGDNVSDMVDKSSEIPTQISSPNSISENEEAGNLVQTVQFSTPSVQNVVSQPPINEQLSKKTLFLRVQKRSELASRWKKGNLCDSGVGNSPTVTGTQSEANKSATLRHRKPVAICTTPTVIIPDDLECDIPQQQTTAKAFEKHPEKEQNCQENISVDRTSQFSPVRCIDLDDLPPTTENTIHRDNRHIIAGNQVSKEARKPQETAPQNPVEDPICVIDDVECIQQPIQFTTLLSPMPFMQPKSIEIAQPQGKKVFILADHQRSVMVHLAVLWKSRTLCDTSIGNGSCRVKMHKVVLAAVSPKLLSVFTTDTLSKNFIQLNLPEDISPEAINAFAEYIYDGHLDLNPDILRHLQTIAKLLSMKEFEQLLDSQLEIALYQIHYNNQMLANLSIPPNITTALTQLSSTSPASSTSTIDIKDEILTGEITQHKENTNNSFESEPEVVSMDVSKNCSSFDNIVTVPCVQTEFVGLEDNLHSQQNDNVSYTSNTNSSGSRIPCPTSDLSALSNKTFVIPVSNTTNSRTLNMVQKSNVKSNTFQISQGDDLSPVPCIVQKICSQPSPIGRNLYKPLGRLVVSREVVCSFDSSTPREKNVSSQSPQAKGVVSIDLTDEPT